jgi:hypothetical protein
MAPIADVAIRIRHRRGALLAAALAASTLVSPARAMDDVQQLRRVPPTIESMTVQARGDRARLTLRFRDDAELPPRLELRLERPVVVLTTPRPHAHGRPRAYKGVVAFDLAGFVERQRELERITDERHEPLATALFDGRRLAGKIPLPPLPLSALKAGVVATLGPYVASADEIDDRASLFVTDLGVVADATRTYDPCTGAGTMLGAWTFGHAMQTLAAAAGAPDAAAFTASWLATFETAATVGSVSVPPRAAGAVDRLLAAWPRQAADPTKLDLGRAPFRLLAIVNRIDLADNLVYGSGPGSAGEGRLVFGAVLPPAATGTNASCVRLKFTVIFEYAIHASSACGDLFTWAARWKALANDPVGSTAYDTALQALTDEFTSGGNGLGQLRTNELLFADPRDVDPPWELREFHLGPGALVLSTVRRTPIAELNASATIASFVNANATDILADAHDVPSAYPGSAPFLGAVARSKIDTFWTGAPAGAITLADARHHFSLDTCSGCHARETETAFTHVNPIADLDSPALLSGFLRGVIPGTTTPFTVTDPESGAVRTFDDLARRRQRLAELAAPICLFQIVHLPLTTPH